MLTSFLAIKIAGLVVSTEQLISVGWFSFFLFSEYLGSNPKIKANSLYQLITNFSKSSRKEDNQLDHILEILRDKQDR